MSTIQVNRFRWTMAGTLGWIKVSGLYQWYTMEPPLAGNPPVKPYAIPTGCYQYAVSPSAKLEARAAADPAFTPYDVIHVLDVPGFDGIEVHPGNFEGDTHGCTLVGMSYKIGPPPMLLDSRAGFDALMRSIDPQGTINYTDEPPPIRL